MKIDISGLQMLVAAIEERSLAKAADREHLVTSAASKRIGELERQVGMTLLRRHNRGVEPTPAGAAFYHRARAIIQDVRKLEDLCQEYSPDGIAKIRLAANRSAIVEFLPRDIGTYQTNNPGARLDLLEALSYDIPRMVSNQEVDIGIYHAAAPAPGVISQLYHTDRSVLVTPAFHPLAGRGPIYMEEARAYDFLGYFPRHSFEAFMELAGPSLRGPLNVKIQVANYEARCRMIREGVGIGIMPERIADTYLAQLGLAKIALKDDWARLQYYVCARERSEMRASAQALWDFLTQVR